MPYGVECCMYPQERAGADVIVYILVRRCECISSIPWLVIIARRSCLFKDIKRESTKCTKRRGRRRPSES